MEWLRARVAETADKAVRIFAHLGPDSARIMGSHLMGDYVTVGIPKIQAPQLQSLMASYCCAIKLGHPMHCHHPWWCLAFCALKMQVEAYAAPNQL